MADELPNLKYRQDIQIFRAFAVIAVVLFHAFPKVFTNGYLGVDIFFVISGFVVTPLISKILFNPNQEFSQLKLLLRNFYIRRLYRLVPALAFVLITFGIVIYFLGQSSDQNRTLYQGIFTSIFLGNLGAYLFDTNYFAPNANPFIHTWSLSVEEQIYFFLPLFVIFAYYFLRKINKVRISKLKILIFLYASLTFISCVVFAFPNIEHLIGKVLGFSLNAWSFYSPLSRLWEFTAGGLLYLMKDFIKNFKLSNKLKIIVLISFLIFISCNLRLERNLGTAIAIFYTLIIIQQKIFDKMPNFSKSRLESIGNQSYSIYLFHMPLLYLAKYSSVFSASKYSDQKILIAIILTFVTGKLSYLFIEERFRIKKKSEIFFFSDFKSIFYVLISVLIVYSIMILGNSKHFLVDQVYGVSNINSLNWDKSCTNWNTFDQPCAYLSKDSKENILLFGDSMAGSISKTVADLGREKSKNVFVYARASCPYILDLNQLGALGQDYIDKNCILHNLNVASLLMKYNIHKVIYFQADPKRYIMPKTVDQSHAIEDELSFKVSKNLKDLRFARQKMLIFGFSPYLDLSKQTRINYLFGNKISFEDVSNSNMVWRKYIRSYNFKYLDVYGLICPASGCKIKIRNGWTLQDDHHLSSAGATFLSSSLGVFLSE